MLRSGYFRRLFALLLLSMFTMAGFSAPVLTSSVSMICPGYAFELDASNFASGTEYYYWERSIDKSNWVNIKTTHLDKKVVDNMLSYDYVYYRVHSTDGVYSNIVTIQKDPSETCGRTCHVTSTGDFFEGTDFDPSGTLAEATIPSGVISYFDENNLTFNKGGVSNYTITDDVSSYLGTIPSKDKENNGGSNYYYVVKEPNSTTFKIGFPTSLYAGKNYRFNMRMYIKLEPGCNQCTNMTFITRTGQGRQSTDFLQMDVYDDASGELIKTFSTTAGGDDPRINIGELCNYDNADWQYKHNHIFRIELTYYGSFPSSPNGLKEWTLIPEFAQFNCGTVAVDYISAESESVCLTSGSVCLGSYAIVNAAGFPRNAKYKWEAYNETTKTWSLLNLNGSDMYGEQYQKVDIFVTKVGSSKFRVSDGNNADLEPIEFYVIGEDCDPIRLDSIIGDSVLCAPGVATMEAAPADASETVSYLWKLTDPNGKEINDKTVLYSGDTRGVTTKVSIPDDPVNYPAGYYTLSVQALKKNSVGITDPVGDIVYKKIHVYTKVNSNFTLAGLNSDGSICPSNIHTKLTATAQSSEADAVYTWSLNGTQTFTGKTAELDYSTDLQSKLCAGTLTAIPVELTVTAHGCESKTKQSFLVKTGDPLEIDCSSLYNVTEDLGAKESKKTVTLPTPTVKTSCESNPLITISGVGYSDSGDKLTISKEFYLQDLYSGKVDMTVTLPSTRISGGIPVTYTAKDACSTSSCSIVVNVKDVTKPDISCENIPQYVAKTSDYEDCEAIPGENSNLPIIKAIPLTDKNGVDGTITGTYMGRWENSNVTANPSKSTSNYDKKINLNDPFPVGISYILWYYYDKSGNFTDCTQRIEVIDNKEPEANCPAETTLYISTDPVASECGTSFDSVLARFDDVFDQIGLHPSAKDRCSSTATIPETSARYFYQVSGSNNWVEVTDKTSLTFKVDTKYDLAWRFYKVGTGSSVDHTVYAECIQHFNIVDSVPPVAPCDKLQSTIVNVNQNTAGHVYTYASGAPQSTRNANTTYSLEGFFTSFPTAYDVCDGKNITPVVTVTTPDGKVTTISNLAQLQKFNFPQADETSNGVSVVRYTYTDSKGNESYCEQQITVYPKGKPILHCKDDLTIGADDKCIGYWDISLADVPTASIPYTLDVRYKDYQYEFDWQTWSLKAPTVVNVKTDNEFSKLTQSSTLSGSETVDNVYPVKVIKLTNLDENGNRTAETQESVINGPKTGYIATKKVYHRVYDQWNQMWDTLSRQTYDSLAVQINNFAESDFTEAFKTFPKGTSKLLWIFVEGDVADTCEQTVIVADTTPTKLTCGDWSKDKTVAADDNCSAEATLVDLIQPTLDDLQASDNCTKKEDLVLSWIRQNPDLTRVTDIDGILHNPFQLGKTLVTWIVTDESGNNSYCNQYITVIDTTGPGDCSSIVKTPSIDAAADENCEATLEQLSVLGLSQLYAPDDECSPTGSPIPGVGVRYFGGKIEEGKSVLKDPYQKGITTIMWTFKDALGNATVCQQFVTVKDTTKPDAPACDSLRSHPLVYNLAADQCEVKLEDVDFGTFYATDNCTDGQIPAVVKMQIGANYFALPSEFKKDTTYNIVYVFEDDDMNREYCERKFQIKDTTPPTPVCPDSVKEMDALSACSFTFEELNLPELTVNDKCDGVLKGVLTAVVAQPAQRTVYVPSEVSFEDIRYYIGDHYFTWTFTDKGKNTSECHMRLHINDKTGPHIENCDVRNEDTLRMSKGHCYATMEDVLGLLVKPIAYDECEDTMRGSSMPLDPIEIQRWYEGTMIAGGDTTSWRADSLPIGQTKFVWIFSDSSGNTSSCEKSVVIANTDELYLNCDSILPLYPVADSGKCIIPLAAVKFEGDHRAYNPCTDVSIVAHISISPVSVIPPTEFDLEVGRTYTFYWTARDRFGNYASCEQLVIPQHNSKVDFDCSTLDSVITKKAEEGTCGLSPAAVGLKTPEFEDACVKDTMLKAVGTRSDSLSMLDDYPTGKTTVTWMFVSPYNISDTLYCSQLVNILGNKHFELNCDSLSPTMRDTVDDCNPSQKLVAVVPWAPDPCISDTTNPEYKRVAVGTRSDGQPLTALFGLGTTTVNWVFTDFTGSVKDSCLQIFDVKTTQSIPTPCINAPMDTVTHGAPDAGQCTVPSDEIPLDTPKVNNPCLTDVPVVVTLVRPGISDLSQPYVIGLNKLLWIFTDTTGTLVKPVDTCEQYVKIGNVDVLPVDCKNFPDRDTVLAEGDCSIDFGAFLLNVPEIWDRCPNGLAGDSVQIKPTITRKALPGWSTDDPATIGSFGLGTDIVYWKYNISGVEYVCTQKITVKDQVAPKFDCEELDQQLIVNATSGTCTAPFDSLHLKDPVAYDSCIGPSLPIPGKLTLTDGSPVPSTFAVGDTTHLMWTFFNDSINTVAKYCYQDVVVKSDIAPIFDCSSLDTLKFTAHDACQIDYLSIDSIPVPEAKDSCTNAKVPGVGVREPNLPLDGTYDLGFHKIIWTFTSPYSTKTKTCEQIVWVRTDKEIDAHCEDLEDTIKVSVMEGVCTVPSSKVNLPKSHSADVPCHSYKIQGVATRSDNMALTDDYPIGLTKITWTFTDESQTLLNPVSYCYQYVQVGDDNKPLVPCETLFPDSTYYLDAENCSLDLAEIKFDTTNMPVNSCNGDTAVLSYVRKSGKALTDPYEVGSDVILWMFNFKATSQTYTCLQHINVVDNTPPPFDCNDLTLPLIVPLTTETPSVPYSTVVEAGFYVPVVTDPCGEVTTVITRSDGKNLEDDYPFGETVVYFSFADEHGNKTECTQLIKVTDMIPPTLNCTEPVANITCLDAIPAPYATIDEFVAAGGSLSDMTKYKEGSFTSTDTVVGNSCGATVYRTYIVYDKRDDRIECKQTLTVKDDVAPEWDTNDSLNGVQFVACDAEVPDFPNFTATDNCSAATVTFTTTSNRGSDPTSCDYYSYDIVRTYSAVDSCGNQAPDVTYTLQVRDTTAPKINLDSTWTEDFEVSNYLKHCSYSVPDIIALLPLDSIFENCTDPNALRMWQVPAEGDTIFKTTYVYVYVADMCGNTDSIAKKVLVPEREKVVNLKTRDTTLCVGDDNVVTLTSGQLRSADGHFYLWDKRKKMWRELGSTFYFDVYRDSVSESSLIYSNNQYTYGTKFLDEKGHENTALRYQLTKLTRASQSGTYYFVAMDTIMQCFDTARAELTLIERPRVLISDGSYSICENDTLSPDELFDDFSACVNDMGSPITAKGWMLGDSIYKSGTPITLSNNNISIAFYATNSCGTTLSTNSLFSTCDGVPVNFADSLYQAGSIENLIQWREDSLYANNSVTLDVHSRYDGNKILLTTDPQDQARVWEGEDATLFLYNPYGNTKTYRWYRVNGEFDGKNAGGYDPYGDIDPEYQIIGDVDDEEMENKPKADTLSLILNEYNLEFLRDSATYYVVISDDVCPAVASNLVSIDVMKSLPTAITPYTKDGMNDVFMKGHHVMIFNRYGQQVYEGNDGWDGSYRGMLADPGVYYYHVDMKNGITYKGSVEVVKIK